MYTARFLYDIYEEKYGIIPLEGENWNLGDEYKRISYSFGYQINNVMRYVRKIEDNVVFHEEEINIVLKKSNKVEVKDEIITILEVVYNLDGSIDYYTDKKEYIPLNTYETYYDGRSEEKSAPVEKPSPPEVKTIYENFTGTEKEHNFWKRLFGR